MAIAVELPGSIKIVNPVPTDYTYGPFTTLAAARSAVPLALRYDGLTVQITGSGNYWWLNGDLTDTGLIVKIPVGTMVTGTFTPPGVLFADAAHNATTISAFTLTQPFGGAILTLTNASGGTTDISGNKVLIDDHSSSAADYSSHGLDIIGATAYYEIRQVGVTNFKGLTYFADYSANYVARSLVDKAYVDSRVSGITNTAILNEIPKSDGVNLVPSGLFSSSTGNLQLGSASLVGATRSIDALGLAANVSILIHPKGTGIFNVDLNSGGVDFITLNNVGLGIGIAPLACRLEVRGNTAVTASPVMALRLSMNSTGTPALGFGTGMLFESETAIGTFVNGAQIYTVVTNIGAGTEAFDLIFGTTVGGAAPTEKLRILSSGHLQLSTGVIIATNIQLSTNGSVGFGDTNVNWSFGCGTNPSISITKLVASTSAFLISSQYGISGSEDGNDFILETGKAYVTSGNGKSGNLYLSIGIPHGSGKYGNLGFFTTSGSFGGGEKVVFQADAITNPTSNPTAGYIIYSDAGNSSHPTVRLPSGSIIDLVNSWQLGGTSTFTGAVLIDETSTGGNTLKFKTAALGVTSVDGKGIWLYNDTTATAGAQQISGAITQEGQGHATTPVNSQSVKFKFYVTPVQGAVNPTGQWDLYQSINAAAYTSLLTAHSSGIIAIGTGTNTPGLVNGVQYSGTYTRLHLWSTAQTLMVIDAANTAATLVFNDRGQSANSRVWGIGNSGAKLLFQAFSDGLVNTDLFQLTRAGNASWLGLSYFGALTAPIHTVDVGGSFGANITSTSVDITLNATHYTVKVDASGANRTITLPAASGVTRRIYIIKKTDSSANTVTIDGNASETIDGATTKVINTQNTGYQIQCDGTNWIIIGAF